MPVLEVVKNLERQKLTQGSPVNCSLQSPLPSGQDFLSDRLIDRWQWPDAKWHQRQQINYSVAVVDKLFILKPSVALAWGEKPVCQSQLSVAGEAIRFGTCRVVSLVKSGPNLWFLNAQSLNCDD
ncbi:hypothetical protein ZHAS_00014860 [Anopheles sinensis]|uniref:Uncharacterized protein n=1 Tax=Anopheles sinensis TaxID=74873 RepID=A0A084W9G0_ANOSI|nr:hypothetical protein ZHAS_00014860 [Anopheles sinensis]